MNKTSIEWTDYTFNPVVGCKHGCWYCYSRRINDRFKWLDDFTKPKFYLDRLHEPYDLKKPVKIFVCSMADLFGYWVPDNWIAKVIGVVQQNPHHTFQFLTKNPKRYLQWKFPKNCWLGTTITGQFRLQDNANITYLMAKDNYKFVSVEPLLGKVDYNLSGIDLVIVGAMTGPGAVEPEKEWIDSINHKNIFFKENIKQYL